MVDKKRKKSKTKTKKRMSKEMIKVVVNNYLNAKELREERKKEARQKRNPFKLKGGRVKGFQRLKGGGERGGPYSLQNKAIDAIGYSSSFRNVNDTRLMALERGMSNALTANIAMLNSVIRHNNNVPLLDNKPHIPDPSLEYKLRNPNYPDQDTLSDISGKSLDFDNFDEIEKLERKYNIDNGVVPPPPAQLETISEEQPDPPSTVKERVEEIESKKLKTIRVKKQPPKGDESTEQIFKIKPQTKPDKLVTARDFGPRPPDSTITRGMSDQELIDRAKFYDLPQLNKFTNRNIKGELTIRAGKREALRETILQRINQLYRTRSSGPGKVPGKSISIFR